jgi:hypothetical protein
MSDLIPLVGAGTTLETVLLADDRATRVGAIQALNYSRAVVITHDLWKEAVGGIPQYSFLLATAREAGTGGGDDDEGAAAPGRGHRLAFAGARPAGG